MTLNLALGIASSALNLAQEGIATASNNIANINTPGYIKQSNTQQSVVISGFGYGAEINGITANVDATLLKSIDSQANSLGGAITQSTYYTNIVMLYGQPNSNNSLSNAIDSFFNAYQNLSNNPTSPSLRVSAVGSANNLATNISTIASGIEMQRFSADQEISNNISTVNNILTDINNYNNQIINFKDNTAGYINIKQQVTQSLTNMSQYINIYTSYDEHGRVAISTGNGVALLDDATNARLRYTPAASVDIFTNGITLNALKVVSLNKDGTDSESFTNLTTSGESSTITTTLSGGSIASLLAIRDDVAPKLLSQLDTLATALNNGVNAIQNDGYGFPPQSDLTGTRYIKNTDKVGFSGSVRIAVLNSDGTAASDPNDPSVGYKPLTLNLGALDGGQPTVQDIMNQINAYYGPAQALGSVGNLHNIQLEATSSSIEDVGTGTFDLKLNNNSKTSSTVQVLGVTVMDPNDATQTYSPCTLPSPNSYTIPAGGMGSTGQSFTVNFGGAKNLSTPYTVRVKVQVTDANGIVSVADVDYSVNDNVTGNKNAQYNATAVTNVSGDSSFTQAQGSTSFARASLVDLSGNEVPLGASGYLKISTTSGKNYTLAISELDSKEIGITGADTSSITNQGFSQYFGLNNLFVDTGKVSGSAINMAVRSDIVANPSLLATGQLTLSSQPSDTSKALYTYQAGAGNNKAALAMAHLGSQSIYFAASGNLPSVNLTYNTYSSDIIGAVSASSLTSANNQKTQQTGMDGLQTLFQKQAGVNSDEQLSKIIQLQNDYGVSAQVISIVRQLYQTLLQAL
jgi:flagellar hook-associated protein 1 FlgK